MHIILDNKFVIVVLCVIGVMLCGIDYATTKHLHVRHLEARLADKPLTVVVTIHHTEYVKSSNSNQGAPGVLYIGCIERQTWAFSKGHKSKKLVSRSGKGCGNQLLELQYSLTQTPLTL